MGEERYAEVRTRGGGGLDPAPAAAARDDREVRAEQVERRPGRAAALDPRMRRAPAGPRARHVVDDLVADAIGLAAVRDDRIGLVAKAELHAEEVAVAARGRDRVLGGELPSFGGRVDSLHHPRVLERALDVVARDGAPLRFVGGEERRTREAGAHERQLPDEIVRALDPGVDAEPAGRRELMRGIPDEQDPTPHELTCHDTVQRPVADRQDLRGYARIADGGADPGDAPRGGEALEGHRGAVVGDLAQPAATRVERLKDAAHVAARDPEEERRAVGDPAIEVRAEVDVDEVAEAVPAVERDAKLLPDPASGTVRGEQVFPLRSIPTAARPLVEVDDHTVVARVDVHHLVPEAQLSQPGRFGAATEDRLEDVLRGEERNLGTHVRTRAGKSRGPHAS